MKATNKNSGFKLPENYLENFNNSLLDKIASQEEMEKDKLPTKEGFNVPNDYFNNLHKNIVEKLNETPIKVISIKSYKKYYYFAIATAAILLLLIGINLNKTETYNMSDLANADIDAYLEYADLDLSAYEIAEVMPIDNLDIIDVLEVGIKEENILDYLDSNMDDFNELNIENNEY
ncbi:hypothetical protein [uncultured Maribacter sp.]|uniref:hypothetical protein n=1 Tax=uncultured Maribacter sp. TaxID=431308 RepID=UPI00260693B5|nr:hypothetical protein [uncultured Maribacter sp.]